MSSPFGSRSPQRPSYAPIGDVAAVIRRLHELRTDRRCLARPQVRSGSGGFRCRSSKAGLRRCRFPARAARWARRTFPTLTFPLGYGVIHGDANVGNGARRRAGSAVLIDLDSFSIGPREWDLIQTALFADRLGWHTAEEYRTFVDVYGYDITRWESYSILADMREVVMTAWMSRKAVVTRRRGGGAEADRGHAHGGNRRDWGAY